MEKARPKLLIQSSSKENEKMCLKECEIDSECFMTLYDTTCGLYKKETQDYLSKTSNQSSITFSIYFKGNMLTSPLYFQNGIYFC